MNNFLIYVIEYGVGKVGVHSTRNGLWYVKRMAKGNPYSVKETLPSGDELVGVRTRWVAHFLKQNFNLVNSKSEQALARKLWLGVKKKHPGNAVNLKPKISSNAEPWEGGAPVKKEEPWSWGA